jgi:hypothetical protein
LGSQKHAIDLRPKGVTVAEEAGVPELIGAAWAGMAPRLSEAPSRTAAMTEARER